MISKAVKNKAYAKKIGGLVTINIIRLLSIMLLVIALTQIPRNLDFRYTYQGEFVSNTKLADIGSNISNYINLVKTREIFDVVVDGSTITTGEVLNRSYKKTMNLFILSFLLSLLIGIPKGILDSRRNKKQSTFKLLQTLVPLSFPDVLTIGAIQIFALYLFRNNIKFLGIGPIQHIGYGNWTNSIYPIISLSLVPAAYIARITATSIENIYTKDYILAAKGKGCSELRIIMVHAIKNIMVDIIASLPAIASIIFSTLVIVERMFYYPGIVYEMIDIYTSSYRYKDPIASGLAFTTLTLALTTTYYIIYAVFDILKNIIAPKLKEQN